MIDSYYDSYSQKTLIIFILHSTVTFNTMFAVLMFVERWSCCTASKQVWPQIPFWWISC